MTIEETLKKLTQEERKVLYWKLKLNEEGKNDVAVGTQLFMSESGVGKVMRDVYQKLGYPVNMPPRDKNRKLIMEVKPVFFALLKNDPENLNNTEIWAEVNQEIQGNQEQEKEPAVEEKPAIVEPITTSIEQKPTPKNTRSREEKEPEPTRRNWWPVALVGVIVVCLSLTVLGAIAFFVVNGFPPWLFPGQTQAPTQGAVPTATIETTVVSTLAITPTNVSTEVSSTTLPLTTTSTVLPTVSPTAKPYYLQGEAAPIRDNVFAVIRTQFESSDGYCGPDGPGFLIQVWVKNESNSQFLLRYDNSKFSAVDDVGTQYTLEGVALNRCNKILGIIDEKQINSGGTEVIWLGFAGQIPLNATYILITAEFPTGTIIFRKEI